MHRLMAFVRSRWEEILILGLAIPLFLGSFASGSPVIVAAIGVGMMLVVWLTFFAVEFVETRRRRQQIGQGIALQIPRRAVVFTVGGQAFTLEYMLARQSPKYVGFICSVQTFPLAERLMEEQNLPADRCKVELVDPWDIRDIRAKTGLVLDWLNEKGVTGHDVVIDVTGGTTPMSVGIFTLAEERRVDTQYLKSQFRDNKPVPSTQEAIIIRHFGSLVGKSE